MLYQKKKKLKALGTKRSFLLNAISTRAIELKVTWNNGLDSRSSKDINKYLELQVLAVVTMCVGITLVILEI